MALPALDLFNSNKTRNVRTTLLVQQAPMGSVAREFSVNNLLRLIISKPNLHVQLLYFVIYFYGLREPIPREQSISPSLPTRSGHSFSLIIYCLFLCTKLLLSTTGLFLGTPFSTAALHVKDLTQTLPGQLDKNAVQQ